MTQPISGQSEREAFEAWWKPVADQMYAAGEARKVDYRHSLALSAWQARAALTTASAGAEPIQLSVIRRWPEGFAARLQHVWLDVVSFIPNVKLYDLQRTLAEFGFMMEVWEASQSPGEAPPGEQRPVAGVPEQGGQT